MNFHFISWGVEGVGEVFEFPSWLLRGLLGGVHGLNEVPEDVVSLR